MASTWLCPPGTVMNWAAIRSERAKQLVRALRDGHCAYASPVECRATGTTDLVIFDVDVERAQHRARAVERVERIAAAFCVTEDLAPEVLALRRDFPVVPHLNLRDEEFPRSLCLYDEPWRDVRRRWTAPTFVETIRTWLALTATGELHADDQPLEPLLLGAAATILFPHDLFDGDGSPAEPLIVSAIDESQSTRLLMARRLGGASPDKGWLSVAVVVVGGALQHGVIRRKPRTLV